MSKSKTKAARGKLTYAERVLKTFALDSPQRRYPCWGGRRKRDKRASR